MKKSCILFISSLLFSSSAFALVDYTDEAEFVPKSSGAQRMIKRPNPNGAKSTKKAPSRKSGNSAPSGMFQLATSYEIVEVQAGEASGKANLLRIDGSFQTSYDIYLDFSYWQADTKNELIGSKDKSHKGNPNIILGFNWLQFGGAADAAAVDLYAGINAGQKNSSFATSRTDKIFGVTTSKRFLDFAFGIGYEYTLTGSPDGDTEMAIGNVQKLSANLGWMVSGDIRASVEGGTYTISPRNDSDRIYKLDEKISFGYIKPNLLLGISPMVHLNLGAVFRTKKVKRNDALGAKLWNLNGAYGNSIFAGLTLNI